MEYERMHLSFLINTLRRELLVIWVVVQNSVMLVGRRSWRLVVSKIRILTQKKILQTSQFLISNVVTSSHSAVP